MSANWPDDFTRAIGAYCPVCGQECVNITASTSPAGWCPDHGKVFINFEPPDDVPVDEEDE